MKKFFLNFVNFFKTNTVEVVTTPVLVNSEIDTLNNSDDDVEKSIHVEEILPVWIAEDIEPLSKIELDAIGILPDMQKVDMKPSKVSLTHCCQKTEELCCKNSKTSKEPRLRNSYNSPDSEKSTDRKPVGKPKPKVIEMENTPISASVKAKMSKDIKEQSNKTKKKKA
jgi:hypothetical protein